jgi:NAD(P)-dependent dehydrogenase (short-subunit alcohol dehydrogenase family)
MDLTNKVVLITGGTRGIGAATAKELAARGADIALAGRVWDDEAQEAKTAVEALGRRALKIEADLGKPTDARRCVEETVSHFGGIDIVVHSAGGPVPGRFLDVSEEDWYAAFDVHVHAIFHLCRAAVPMMTPRGEGAIILVSSAAGLRGVLGAAAYATVKGTLPHLTRVLARELADQNIRVNCIAPGVIRTRFHAQMTKDTYRNNLDNRIPLHREGTSEQVAEGIALLVENDFITGETLTIDGGLTMRIA